MDDWRGEHIIGDSYTAKCRVYERLELVIHQLLELYMHATNPLPIFGKCLFRWYFVPCRAV